MLKYKFSMFFHLLYFLKCGIWTQRSYEIQVSFHWQNYRWCMFLYQENAISGSALVISGHWCSTSRSMNWMRMVKWPFSNNILTFSCINSNNFIKIPFSSSAIWLHIGSDNIEKAGLMLDFFPFIYPSFKVRNRASMSFRG